MAANKKFKIDLGFLSKSPVIKQVSKQWTEYETKVKEFVTDLNLKSLDAREKSKHQLDKFAGQLKATRTQVEKRVHEVLDQEAKTLNKGFTELKAYLKSLSTQEATVPSTKEAKPPGPTAKKKKSAGTSKTAEKKTVKRGTKRPKSTVKGNGADNVTV